MFLDWILKLGFIQADPESGVFLAFPKEIRRNMARDCVEHLLNDPEATMRLTSSQHVKVIMETVGQAFGLDVEDAPIISRVTDLYRRWLFEHDLGRRPLPVMAEEEYVYLKIFEHFSLLFSPRAAVGKTPVTEAHAKLCSTVLEIFESAGRELGPKFTLEAWHTMLKILLGICDHLLKAPEDQSPLATMLCPQLIKVLFSLWIRSGTTDDWMWKKLKELIMTWRHRIPVIMQWNFTCNGFTNALLRYLYVSKDPKINVAILGPSDLPMILESEYITYAWYRLLHLLGDLEQLAEPDIYYEAMKGVRNLVSMFLAVGKNRLGENTPRPPDGNIILHIFGEFLLDAANIYRPGFERGKAEAFESLLALFTGKSDTDFLPEYLASFYRGIEMGIQQDNSLMDVIIRASTALFPSELKGSRILLPAYLNSIQRVLVEPGWSRLERIKAPAHDLRRACYKIASYMLTLPPIYKTAGFKASKHLIEPLGFNTYEDLKKLRDVLLGNLRKEPDDENKKLLIWLCLEFIYESVNHEAVNHFPQAYITTLIQKITSQPEVWSTTVILSALKALYDLAKLYPHLAKDNAEVAPVVVRELCSYLELQIKKQAKEGKLDEDLIINCYNCIGEWSMQGQWLLKQQNEVGPLEDNKGLLYRVFEIAEIGLTGRKGVLPMNSQQIQTLTQQRAELQQQGGGGGAPQAIVSNEQYYFDPTQAIREVSEMIILNLLTKLDTFPMSKFGPTSVSSQANELQVLNNVKDSSLSVYVSDTNILSLIRHPRDPGTGNFKVTAITRDMTGKYAWNMSLKFPQPQNAASNYVPKENSKNILDTPPTEPIDPMFLEDLFSFLGEEERRKHDMITRKAKERTEQEKNVLKQRKFGLDCDVTMRQPALPAIDTSLDSTPTRLFLSHAGFLEINIRDRFSGIKINENFSHAFQQLDMAVERECYTIGVLYWKRGKKSDRDLFVQEPQDCSLEYHNFINNLGWEIDLQKHVGFKGGLRPDVTGPTTRYHATYSTEVVFHVATMMPTLHNTDQEHKRNLIYLDRVLIIWMENITEYNELVFANHFRAAIKLLVVPLNNELYRVRILYDKDRSLLGPLTDENVVTRHTLATLIRQTAINGAILERERETAKPPLIRRAMVEDFIRKFKQTPMLYEFYAEQFA